VRIAEHSFRDGGATPSARGRALKVTLLRFGQLQAGTDSGSSLPVAYTHKPLLRLLRRRRSKPTSEPRPDGGLAVSPRLLDLGLLAQIGCRGVRCRRAGLRGISLQAQGEELDARRREVQELHVLLQTAQAALTAPESRPWWKIW